MKTYFSFVLCLLASLLVTACDNDKEEENNKVVIDGETYTEVNISLSQSDETPFNDDVLPESYPLDFYLMNVESEAISCYQTEVLFRDDQVLCSMLVPEEAPLADGHYLLLMVFHSDQKRYPFQLELIFKDQKCVAVGEYTELYKGLDGAGTPENPYKIKKYRDLFILHTDLKKDLTRASGKHFRQVREIDLNEYYNDPDRVVEQGWPGIANGFAGIYDGNGTIIYNLMSEATHDTVGFFSSLGDGAVVKDLSFSSVSIKTSGRNCVGAIAGASTGHVTLEGINVGGLLSGAQNVGGFIGVVEGTVSIAECSNEGLTVSAGGYAGGFVGKAMKGITCKHSSLNATVISSGNYAGGAVGYVESGSSLFDDVDTFATFSLSGGNATGGLAGYVGGSFHISNVLMVKTATASTAADAISGGNNTGGLLGETSPLPGSSLKNCKFEMRLKGADNSGGFIGKVAQGNGGGLQLLQCHSGTMGNVKGTNNTGGAIGMSEVNVTISNPAPDNAIRFQVPVVGTGRSTGGLIGHLNQATFTNLIVASNVTGEDVVGGFFGEGDKPVFINSRTDSLIRIQGNSNVGGVGGAVYSPSIHSGSDFSALINPDDHYAKSATKVGGLFGYARTVNLDGVSVRSKVRGKEMAGGLIGMADEEVQINNCRNYSTVDAGENTGGFVGIAKGQSFSMKNCYNHGKVSGSGNVGGIVGQMQVSFALTEIHNRADVVNTGDRSGGVCGYNYAKGAYERCTNTGAVSGKNKVGGIAGTTDESAHKSDFLDLTYCANSGAIEGDDKSIGGLVGFVFGQFRINKSYNKGKHTGKENIGGIVGEISGYYHGEGDQRINDCYNRGASDGSKHRAGIIGYKGDDAGVNSLIIRRCYNSANTGWGIFGGISNRFSYKYENVYYIDTNSSDLSGSAKKCTLSELKALRLGDAWQTASGSLPTLKGAPEL